MPLINFEINLILTWPANCLLIVDSVANQVPTFTITDMKLYVPVLTLSTQDNAKLLQQLKQDFKGAEETCVQKVTVMKNNLDWKICLISMLSEIFNSYEHVLAVLFRKYEANFPRLYSRIRLNLQIITIFFRTTKPTLAESLKFPWHGF